MSAFNGHSSVLDNKRTSSGINTQLIPCMIEIIILKQNYLIILCFVAKERIKNSTSHTQQHNNHTHTHTQLFPYLAIRFCRWTKPPHTAVSTVTNAIFQQQQNLLIVLLRIVCVSSGLLLYEMLWRAVSLFVHTTRGCGKSYTMYVCCTANALLQFHSICIIILCVLCKCQPKQDNSHWLFAFAYTVDSNYEWIYASAGMHQYDVVKDELNSRRSIASESNRKGMKADASFNKECRYIKRMTRRWMRLIPITWPGLLLPSRYGIIRCTLRKWYAK